MKRNFDDPQYKQWRKAVRKRDNSTCIWPNCNSKKRIHTHHIYPWAQFPHLRYVVENGSCLCYQHHKMVNTNELIYASLLLSILKNRPKSPKTRKPPTKTTKPLSAAKPKRNRKKP